MNGAARAQILQLYGTSYLFVKNTLGGQMRRRFTTLTAARWPMSHVESIAFSMLSKGYLLESLSLLVASHSQEDCRSCLMLVPRATCKGVNPLFPSAWTSAPRERRKATISVFPHLTARCKGESPSLSRISMSAPQSSNASATGTFPRRAAMWSAVHCLSLS
jgi:hypothetical protein